MWILKEVAFLQLFDTWTAERMQHEHMIPPIPNQSINQPCRLNPKLVGVNYVNPLSIPIHLDHFIPPQATSINNENISTNQSTTPQSQIVQFAI